MEQELARIKTSVIQFIAKAVAYYGEPCYVTYNNFYLKHLGLSGLYGRRVSVINGRVILGDDENGMGDISDDLEYLSVIAEALANPENISHESD